MKYTSAFNPSFPPKLGADIGQLWPESEQLRRNGKKRDTLGLALSGGGYRSAIFGYGILRGLWEGNSGVKLLPKVDYLSSVSGGSWIATPFAMSTDLEKFFDIPDDHANFMEEGFESLLVNPIRVAEEAAMTRQSRNFVSDLFGRVLARTFLREHGDDSRYRQLNAPGFINDNDRPFLIVNGTMNYRSPSTFHVTQECFEMTRLYCGTRSLGYVDTGDLIANYENDSKVGSPIRIRDAIAMSGAAVAVHLPGLGGEVSGHGLSREIRNFAIGQVTPALKEAPEVDDLDVADGGHYNNLGIETLVNRGCGYIIVVDAEHDPETKNNKRSNQKYEGLKTLMKRNNVPQPVSDADLSELDRADEPVHVIEGDGKIPDILYVKLKSFAAFDKEASKRRYNQPGFLGGLFGGGKFAFDPQFSTAKLDYSFAEHRNLMELGTFIVRKHQDIFNEFVSRSR